jgi:hypothetical protein
VVPFTPVSGFFVFESLGVTGDKDLCMPGQVGVVGEWSNPDFNGVWSVKGAGLSELPSSLTVLVLFSVGANKPDAPFVVGNPETFGPF